VKLLLVAAANHNDISSSPEVAASQSLVSFHWSFCALAFWTTITSHCRPRPWYHNIAKWVSAKAVHG